MHEQIPSRPGAEPRYERMSTKPLPLAERSFMPSPLLRRAYEKAQEALRDEGEIDPRTFTHFDTDMVEEDLETVVRLEDQFSNHSTPESRLALMRATVLEAIIHDQMELNDWLGSEVITRRASRYDDIVNGVDSIAEFPQTTGRAYLALNMDVTSGPPDKKLARIREEIDGGTLGKVKYFESSDGTFQGSLSLVPRVIIGVDAHSIERLAELWVSGENRTLAKDPVQVQILDEIILQLKAFRSYATARGATAAAAAYDRVLSLVSSVAQQKNKKEIRSQPNTQRQMMNDVFYRSLDAELEKTFRPPKTARRVVTLGNRPDRTAPPL